MRAMKLRFVFELKPQYSQSQSISTQPNNKNTKPSPQKAKSTRCTHNSSTWAQNQDKSGRTNASNNRDKSSNPKQSPNSSILSLCMELSRLYLWWLLWEGSWCGLRGNWAGMAGDFLIFDVLDWMLLFIFSIGCYILFEMSKLSIVRSDRSKKTPRIQQTKSEIFQQETAGQKQSSDWYDKKCSKVFNKLTSSSIPQQKNSQPYRLVLQKITNLTQNKKSSSAIAYLCIMANFITDDLETIGKTCLYQSELPISGDKIPEPICLYYHSKIDKSSSKIKIILKFSLQEYRDGIVESVTNLGIGIVDSPFIEQQIKSAPTYKQCSQLEIVSKVLQNPPIGSMTFSYYIQSKLELKSMIKFIPSQTILTCQDHVAGIYNQYLPQSKDDPVEDEQSSFVNLTFCQIHMQDKFQELAIAAAAGQSDKKQQISKRKIVCGFHNQYQIVLPVTRNLDSIGKQATGQYTMLIYEALGDNQNIKVPYYFHQKSVTNSCSLTISLIFTIGQTDYQVAIFAFNPIPNTHPQQMSVNMTIGSGEGIVGNLLPIKSNRPPTIILEYATQDVIRTRDKLDEDRRESQKRVEKSLKNIKQSAKFMEDLEKQRLNLQKQKEEIQYMRTRNYINYQDEFEKKMMEEREQLRIRQQMIENQYREEVERQIKHKVELQNEIRMMREKISAIEEGQKNQMPSRKVSYYQTPAQFDPAFTTSFNANTNANVPLMRQKVNPNYLLEQQKTIPLNQVRDIMAKTFQLNRDTLQKQMTFFTTASKFTFLFSSIVWSSSVKPPKSFYMIIKFFNFKQFTSDPITYIDSGFQYHQLVRVNHYTYNLENTTPSYQFVVDPSLYANPEIIQEDLVNYLAKNNAIVDLFDAENYLYIGQINIKMSELFRGSKSQVMIAKQFNLVRLKGQENYGVIQVLIKNQMAQCKQQISLLQKRTVKQIKKKVVSNNPILLTKQIFENQKVAVSQIGSKHPNQGRNRQEKRIEMYKKKAAEGKRKNNFDEIENNDKGRIIEKIYEYKQKQKPQFIKKVYEELLTDKISINPYFGQTKTFLYQFTNMSQSPSSFRVSFQGDSKQLSLVQDSQEWKYYVSQNRYPSPKIYDCINDQNSFYLSPGQTIPLVFKYLSFSKLQNGNHKSTTVTITKQQNNWIVSGFTLNIQSHESIINHSYILYQPGDQVIDLIIPVIFSSNDTRTPKRLFLTIEEASAEWISQYEIMLRVRTPPIMNMLKFNMLLYEDDFFCVLKENWLIQLHAYEGVYAVAKADEKTRFKISVPEQVNLQLKPHRIQFNSSHPDLVFESDKIEGTKLARGSIENWCQLLPGNTSVGAIQITCIDEKKQLLYGWIVQVYPYSAKIS